jgi:alpha-galactosidase
LGLRGPEKTYLAVWRLQGGTKDVKLPIQGYRGKELSVRCGYPNRADCDWHWDKKEGNLAVTLPAEFTARIFELQ